MKFGGSIEGKDIQVLCNCLSQAKPNSGPFKILEIGVHNGDTARGMKEYVEKDLKMSILYTGIDNQRDLSINPPFEGASIVIGDSAEVFHLIKETFNFIFIDGCHCFNHVILDFYNYENKLLPNGIIAFHDSSPHIQGLDKVNEYQGHGPKIAEFNMDVRRAVIAVIKYSDRYDLIEDSWDNRGIMAYRKKK